MTLANKDYRPLTSGNSRSIIKKIVISAICMMVISTVASIFLSLIQGEYSIIGSNWWYNFIGFLMVAIYPVSFAFSYFFIAGRPGTRGPDMSHPLYQVATANKLFIQRGQGDTAITTTIDFGIVEEPGMLYMQIAIPIGLPLEKVTKAIPLFESVVRGKAVKVEEDYDSIYVAFRTADVTVSTDHLYSGEQRKYPIFGFTVNGETVEWNYDQEAHLGVYARSGSGKSVFTKQVVKQLADSGAEMKFIDIKRVEFGPLRKLGYEVATENVAALDMVRDLYEEILRRNTLLEENDKQVYYQMGMRPIFLVFDEFSSMAESFSTDTEGKAQKKEFMTLVGHIARLGRASGINLVLVTQRPDTSFLPGEIRMNLNKSVVLMGGDSTIRRMAFGDSYGELSPLNKGMAYVNVDTSIETVNIPFYEGDNFLEDMGQQSA